MADSKETKQKDKYDGPPIMTKEDFIYSRIGMALLSTQRVEYITGKLLEQLIEFDKTIYGITTSEFLEKSAKSKSAFKTLGSIFHLLKLNPKLIIEDELDNYLKKRNLFVHNFWFTFLTPRSDDKEIAAVDFCYDFGRHSDRIESFFKGFVYFLMLRHVKNREELNHEMRQWDKDFDFFMSSLKGKGID